MYHPIWKSRPHPEMKWPGPYSRLQFTTFTLGDKPVGRLRNDSPFTAPGPTFIDDALRAAHEADPAARLFYNDYEIEGAGSAKVDGAYCLVKRLKESGVPLHGIGLQIQVDPRSWPSADRSRQNMLRFADPGGLVEITEMTSRWARCGERSIRSSSGSGLSRMTSCRRASV